MSLISVTRQCFTKYTHIHKELTLSIADNYPLYIVFQIFDTMSRFRHVKCLLFDMDGLLLDTENLYTQGTQQILSQYNQAYSWELKTKLMGKRTDEVARMIIEHYQLPLTPEEWITKSRDIYNDLFPTVKSLPGVTKLVHHPAKNKIPMSVASSSSSSAFQLKSYL